MWSKTSCETKCGLANGDTTTTGTRTPYLSNAAAVSPGCSIGGMPSGTTARVGEAWS